MAEFYILRTELLRDRRVLVDAITRDGRRIGTVVAWEESSLEGMTAGLERALALEVAADAERAGALASLQADMRDPPQETGAS